MLHKLISFFLCLSNFNANTKAVSETKILNAKDKRVVNDSDETKENNINLSVIFDQEPLRWGLRGDPWFWRYLKKLFQNYNFMISEKELEKIIKDEYNKLTDKELNIDSYAYCKQFDHGGMSGGGISGKFWINAGIPVLKDRLKRLQL